MSFSFEFTTVILKWGLSTDTCLNNTLLGSFDWKVITSVCKIAAPTYV